MDARKGQRGRDTKAVGYVRRSTESQERSLEDQREAIRRHARQHGLRVLRVYCDDAISGTRSKARKAFQEMLRDAQSPQCDFGVVLVYDIKRFGRVDNDEAGHYRWLLRQRGVRVEYLAEGFAGTTVDDLVRPVKQWQAREESRDLSRITIRGLLSKRHAQLNRGLWFGGFPPFGYDLRYESAEGVFRYVVRYHRDATKELLDADGRVIVRTPRGQPHVVSKSEICTLIPSDPERVRAVQRIYREFVREGRSPVQIAKSLNADGVPTSRGPAWASHLHGLWHEISIGGILRNPAYVGDLVWNRRTQARFFRIAQGAAVVREDADLRRTTFNRREDWMVAQDAHAALVCRGEWEAAQGRLARSERTVTNVAAPRWDQT